MRDALNTSGGNYYLFRRNTYPETKASNNITDTISRLQEIRYINILK